jgi:methionyl-tRNA formyltransferase
MSDTQRPTYGFIGQSLMGEAALNETIAALGEPAIVLTRSTLDGWPNPVAELCRRRGLRWEPVAESDLNLAGAAAIAELARADVAVCCGWPRRIAAVGFDAPRLGTLNLHPGALPTWAGSNPIGWHLAAGTGPILCTVHRMTARVDSGAVLAVRAVDVAPDDDAANLRRKCGAVLGRLAAEVILSSVTEELGAVSFDQQQAVPPRGVRPALDIALLSVATAERVIRAFSPYPGALAIHEGEWIAVVHPADSTAAQVRLVCRDGTLTVGRV